MKILIVEDDQALADGLQRFLAQQGYLTDLARTGTEAAAILTNEQHDLVVLDIELPGMNGLTLLQRISKYAPQLPVLIITARDGVKDRITGLDLGADDYLVKPFELSELAARIRAVIRRGQAVHAGRINYGRIVLDIFAKQVLLDGKDLNLAKREFDLLEYLALRPGKVTSKSQLISRLTEDDEDISANAVEVYLHRLRNKLGEDSGIVIHSVRGFGYYLEHTEPRSN